MNRVTLTWYGCECEIRTKYCDDYHRSTANVNKEDLYRFLEGLA